MVLQAYPCLDEQPCHLGSRSERCSDVEEIEPVLGLCDGSAAFEQKLHFTMTRQSDGVVQRRGVSYKALVADVRTPVQQAFDHWASSGNRCVEQRRLLKAVLSFHTCAVLDQHVDRRNVAALNG
mmetsp:Transcript_66885/g.184836  ORF Transcript_66885/g.184836 Transcript_66885/m.184836 type:complete len:124 (-) Transcript_66885:160-531(-)